jgi:hypothetical protein
MVKCSDCKKGMSEVKSCSPKFRCIKINGEIYPRDTTQFDWNDRCHDCGIENKIGNLHHMGCDMERCPKCKGQLISCDCKKEAIGINGKWKKVS